MPHMTANNISICYDTLGNPADPAFLLISGLGSQLIDWPQAFAEKLADEGFYVIRFDNRDIGLGCARLGSTCPARVDGEGL